MSHSSTAIARFGLPGGPRFEVVGRASDPTMRTLTVDDGVYEEHLMRLFGRIVEPGSVVVDAGAHIGLHTLLLARLARPGVVYAFEPAVDTHEFLVANLARNRVENVVPVAAALGEAAGSATLAFDPDWPGGAHVAAGGSEGRRIEIATLDEWVERHDLRRLDLVKLDVEGSEPAALAGAHRTLERFRPALVVEFHPLALRRVAGRAPEDFFAELTERFATVAVVTRRGRSVRVASWRHLAGLLARRGIVDLLCLPGRPGPVRRLVGLAHAAAVGVRRRWPRPPRRAVVFAPDYRLEPKVSDLVVAPGERVVVPAALENRGETWLSSDFVEGPVMASYHWLDEGGGVAVFEGLRSNLPAPVPPGGTCDLEIHVEAPERPGTYVLELSLLQDGWAWADQVDPRLAVHVPVEVRSGA